MTPSPLGKMTKEVVFRDWRPDDPLGEITKLLHRAYTGLAQMGFNYTASYQNDSETRRRLREDSSLIAECQGRIVGTVTLYPPKVDASCAWYRHAYHFGQFGVDPDMQQRGIGRELLRMIEGRARRQEATELALDTSEGAEHLCRWYGRKGYRFVEHVTWPGKTYRSVVLSKALRTSSPVSIPGIGDRSG